MSFKLKLNSINLDCAPMITEGFNGETNLIGYMCKNNNTRDIEGFEDIQDYDNNKQYKYGDMVTYQESVFKMVDSDQLPVGYAPDRENDRAWALVSGPGNKVHRRKMQVPIFQKVPEVYEVKSEPIKAKPEPESESEESESIELYDNNKNYVKGDKVIYNGQVYTLRDITIDGGPAITVGNPPGKIDDNSWVPENNRIDNAKQAQQAQQPQKVKRRILTPGKIGGSRSPVRVKKTSTK